MQRPDKQRQPLKGKTGYFQKKRQTDKDPHTPKINTGVTRVQGHIQGFASPTSDALRLGAEGAIPVRRQIRRKRERRG